MEECLICLDLYIDKCVTSCNHSFCKKLEVKKFIVDDEPSDPESD